MRRSESCKYTVVLIKIKLPISVEQLTLGKRMGNYAGVIKNPPSKGTKRNLRNISYSSLLLLYLAQI